MKIKTILVASTLVLIPIKQAHAGFVADLASQVTQVAHMGVNGAGWIGNLEQGYEAQLTRLNQLSEAVTNNVFTKAIKGFSELQTALQTDMSSVLGLPGHIMSLFSAPMSFINSIKDVLGNFMSLPTEAQDIVSGTGMGSGFLGKMFTGMGDSFSTLQKTMKERAGGVDTYGKYGNPDDFSRDVSRTRNAAAVNFLADRDERRTYYTNVDTQLNQYEQESADAAGETNAITIQATANKIAAAQARMQARNIANQDRAQSFHSLDVQTQQSAQDAQDAAYFSQLRANTGRAYSETDQYIESMSF